MEAQVCGIPTVCSSVRGNVDLIVNGKSGYLCSPHDAQMFAKYIELMYSDVEQRRAFSEQTKKHIKAFGEGVVEKELVKIYKLI
jgi:glycosyltransferase involved in cell wall biosynthesis